MDYESLIVTMSELKEEIELTNILIQSIYHVLCDMVYITDTKPDK